VGQGAHSGEGGAARLAWNALRAVLGGPGEGQGVQLGDDKAPAKERHKLGKLRLAWLAATGNLRIWMPEAACHNRAADWLS
jgi:hypothetical protein